jgi:GT2 family glycosyltransferase
MDKPRFPKSTRHKYTLVQQEVNLGEQFTVNAGLRLVTKSRSKYFMIVNADDPLLPGAITRLVEFMELNPDVLCGYPDWRAIDEEGVTRLHRESREYDFQWMVSHHNWLPSVGSIFKSSLIKLIGYRDPSFRWLGDADYWLRVGLAGKMAHVPYELACWRHREGQATSQKSSKRAKEHIRVIYKLYATPDLPEYLRDVKWQAFCWCYLVATAVTNSKVDIIKYLCRAFLACPWMIVTLTFWDNAVKRLNYILRR